VYLRYTFVNAYAAFNVGDFLFSNIGYVWFLSVGYMPVCYLFTIFGSFSVVTTSAYLTVWVSQCILYGYHNVYSYIHYTCTTVVHYFVFLVLKFMGGNMMVQLVAELCYKPEGLGFDSRWCHWNFSLT
jgi:hypothetical protein